ncbi:MAG TPA: DUF1573 domain-containing protein [Planctomycetaceae bacterium]|nr:DUF1573 domain-containing protein [Planctomycetaceae bacterium]
MRRCLSTFLILTASALAFAGLRALETSAEPKAAASAADAPSGGPNSGRDAPAGPCPRAVVDEPTHHFGTIHVGERRSHVFVIRNDGDAALVLGEPDSTCKCTVGQLAGNTIPPGGSVEVTLEWKPVKIAGEFREGAEIPTNDPDRKLIYLVVEGRVEPLLVVSPTFHWDAGDFAGDEPQTVTGTIHATMIESFALVKAECTNPLFSARAVPLDDARRKKLAAKSGYAVEVTIDPRTPEGPVESLLRIETDVDGAREFEIRVTAERHGPVRFLPGRGVQWDGLNRAIDLGRFAAEEGRSATLSLFVTDPPGEPFRVTNIEQTPEFLDVTLSENTNFHAPGRRRCELTLSVPAGSPQSVRLRENSARVRLSTNHPAAPTVTLYVEFRSFASRP